METANTDTLQYCDEKLVSKDEHIHLRNIRSMKLNYLPCLNCARHPWYPDIPAITLHEGDKCLICESEEAIPA